MPFVKGHQKMGGRVAGTPNKIDLKEATLKAFDEVGGAEYLKNIARTAPNAFLNFVGKFVAKDVMLSQNPEKEPVEFIIRGISDKGTSNTSSS